jgi:hypothetical protein
MSSKRVRLITITGIILIALVIGASALIGYLSKDTKEIPLPTAGASPSPVETADSPAVDGLEYIIITKDNVQDVIATLHRPDAYSRTVKIEVHYEGDSTTYHISTFFDNGATALQMRSEGKKKNTVIAGGKLYIWYDGDKTPYERPISPEDEKKSSDEYQMMSSYEDVLKLDKSSITAAEYVDYESERCIYVQYVTELLGYTEKYYISVGTGLLVHIEKYDGNTLIYQMSSSDYSPTRPDASVFKLPDGTIPVSAP